MRAGTDIGGRYRVVRSIGRGGMGEVFEVIDQQTDRARALKLLFARLSGEADARERFDREARIAGRVETPHLVEVFDTGVDADTQRLYLVMELLSGETLEERLARLGPRPFEEVVLHLAQVAVAVDALHAHGVIHRDLKPANLFLHERPSEDARVKVLDLGLAKVVREDAPATTDALGTVGYVALEQLRGRGIGPATDVHAFGLTAFTLLVGKPYWHEARGRDLLAFALLARHGPPEPATVRAAAAGVGLPAAFDAWFARVTAEPDARPDMITALRELAVALDVAAPAGLPATGTAPRVASTTEPADEAPPAALPTAQAETQPGSSAGGMAEAPTVLALATHGDAPARKRRRRRWLWVLTAAALAGAAGAASQIVQRPATKSQIVPRPATNVLASPQSILACPILGVENTARDGWLGAAAASIACTRARALLGDASVRTLLPVELLGLQGLIDPDADPFVAPEARARSVDAARRLGHAYLDGQVSLVGTRFRVQLTLRRADGVMLGDGLGDGVSLPAAVRAAMAPLVERGALPTVRPPAAVLDYARARDAAELLQLTDLAMAVVNHAADLEDQCALLDGASTDLAPFLLHICRQQLGEKGVAGARVEPPAASTAGGRTARARVRRLLRDTDPSATEQLRRQYDAERDPGVKSTIAATLSCQLQVDAATSARDQAPTWAWQAVDDDPKNVHGEWCYPWGQLLSLVADTRDGGKATARWAAWTPWDSYAWWYLSKRAAPARAATLVERAYALSPLDTNVAGRTAELRLEAGLTTQAEAVAQSLLSSSHALHQVAGAQIAADVRAHDAEFKRALEVARAAMVPRSTDAGWTQSLRLAIAADAVTLAVLLGRPSEVADAVIAAFTSQGGLPFAGSAEHERRLIASICAYASPAGSAQCFEAMDGLRGGATAQSAAFIAGARRYALRDLTGAAAAWRPLVRDADEHLAVMPEAMVTAFAAAGELELALEVDRRTRELAPLYGGATMAMARAALAVAADGDPVEASARAKVVIDAWRFADEQPPIVRDLRRLVR